MKFLQQNLFLSCIQGLKVLDLLVFGSLPVLQLKIKLGSEFFANFLSEIFLNFLCGFQRRLEADDLLFFMAFSVAFPGIWNCGDVVIAFSLFFIFKEGFVSFWWFWGQFWLGNCRFTFASATRIIGAFFAWDFALYFGSWCASLMGRVQYQSMLLVIFCNTSLENVILVVFFLFVYNDIDLWAAFVLISARTMFWLIFCISNWH